MIRRVLKFWLLLLAGPVLAQGGPFVRAEIQTGKVVIVGQPVILSVQVYVPNWFTAAPEFPEISVSNAIVTPPGNSTNLNERIGGQSYAGIQREYTIYPRIPGEYQVDPFAIGVRYALENAQPSPLTTVKVAAMRFSAMVPKEAAGLPYFISTNRLTLRQTIKPEEDTLKVGDALERSISVTVRDALSMVIPPLAFETPGGLAVYPASPTVTDKGGERGDPHIGSRVESVTYIMQEEGDYELPAIEISWWDLSANKLRRSTVAAVKFTVIPNPEFSAEFPMEKDSTVMETEAAAQGKNNLVYFMLAAAFVLGISYWLFRRYGTALHARYAAAQYRRRESEAAYFNRFRRACQRNDAPEAMNHLLLWLNKTGEFPPAASTASLVHKAADPELTSAINDLKEKLYGLKQSAQKEWEGKILLQTVSNFRKSRKRKLTGEKGLVPLNPVLVFLPDVF
ncbi:MAG: BatD family protein [Calditrichaceae bacterium]|nr:BatD family protein [Calditrichia bacterium]NUQ43934.1 BatD family protein [Calditrichaceae bacterium]